MNITQGINPKSIKFSDANKRLRRISLWKMRKGKAARNNCYNAAHAVSAVLDSEGHDAYVVGLIFNNAEHWASSIQGKGNSVMVVDYTLRQFAVGAGVDEEKIPYPFIAPYGEWRATVEGWAAARWNETLVTSDTEEIRA